MFRLPDGETGQRLLAWQGWVARSAEGADAVVYERPVLARSTTSYHTALQLMAQAGIVALVCAARGIPVRDIQAATIKKHWARSGKAGKGEMVQGCIIRGWRCADDNEADALALWDLGALLIQTRRWMPKGRALGPGSNPQGRPCSEGG